MSWFCGVMCLEYVQLADMSPAFLGGWHFTGISSLLFSTGGNAGKKQSVGKHLRGVVWAS